MSLSAQIVIGLVAIIHLYIMGFEMFAWTSRGPKVFKSFPKDLFEPTKAMAANQGLYNGFLSSWLNLGLTNLRSSLERMRRLVFFSLV